MYPNGCKSKGSSAGTLSVFTASGTSLQSNKAFTDRSYDSYLNFTLAPGSYIITVQMSKWGTNDKKDYTVRVHSPETIAISKFTDSQITAFKTTVLNNLMASGLSAFITTSKLTSMSDTAYTGVADISFFAYMNTTKSTCATNTATLTIYNV